MNRAEQIRILREDFLDDVSDQPDQDDDEYLWSSSFLSRALSRADVEACRRTDLIYDATTASVCTITLATGTASYTTSGKIRRIERVTYDDEPLNHLTKDELRSEYGDTWRTDTGPPTGYVITGRTLRVYPVPTSDEDTDTLTLEVFRLPLYTFSTESELPEEYHYDVCYYAAYLAFLRRDEDTYDPNRAGEMLGMFNAAFGEPVDARVTEHQMRSPATLQIRPDFGYSDNRLNT